LLNLSTNKYYPDLFFLLMLVQRGTPLSIYQTPDELAKHLGGSADDPTGMTEAATISRCSLRRGRDCPLVQITDGVSYLTVKGRTTIA
jgi:hypothetical protein